MNRFIIALILALSPVSARAAEAPAPLYMITYDHGGLILNETNYGKAAWTTVQAVPRSQRMAHLHSALAAATVRMPEQKARWLIDNFDRIEQMGGIAAALGRIRNLKRNRSQACSLGRLETERLKTIIWCRRARISVWSARRIRKPARMVEINEIRMLHMNREAISSIP